MTASYFKRSLFLESATGMEKKINNNSSHRAVTRLKKKKKLKPTHVRFTFSPLHPYELFCGNKDYTSSFLMRLKVKIKLAQ